MSHFQNIAPSIATLLKKESEVLSDIAAIKRAIQFVPPPPPALLHLIYTALIQAHFYKSMFSW